MERQAEIQGERRAGEKKLYRSPYEAYPFLADPGEDLRCDFELLTDELSSLTGLLLAVLKRKEGARASQAKENVFQAEEDASLTEGNASLTEELLRVDELIYHANPTLRTRLTLTREEVDWLAGRVRVLQDMVGEGRSAFVLPQGCEEACMAHLLRVKAKELVRLLYRHARQEHPVPELLFDFANLLSGYYFGLALLFNRENDVRERVFVSRNYF